MNISKLLKTFFKPKEQTVEVSLPKNIETSEKLDLDKILNIIY